MDTAVHILRLVLSGALDRHPRLQLITGHMGEGLPAMLARFDQMFESVRSRHLSRPIRQTILDQVHVTTSGFVTEPPYRTVEFLKAMSVSEEDRIKIAHGNADRLLKLKF